MQLFLTLGMKHQLAILFMVLSDVNINLWVMCLDKIKPQVIEEP